ncbi:hypothetical protein CR513_42792, partial [Mucuna pruriens]
KYSKEPNIPLRSFDLLVYLLQLLIRLKDILRNVFLSFGDVLHEFLELQDFSTRHRGEFDKPKDPQAITNQKIHTKTRDTQSINAKVETLSKGKEENRQPSIQESGASHEEGQVSGSSRSHRSHRHGYSERIERHGRHRMERNEPRKDKLDSVEQLFEYHDISEKLKVKLVTLEFSSYTLVWWYQVVYDDKRMWRPPCDTWAELKRFVPSNYAKDLSVKLQILYQGSKSVEEYYKEI